MRERCQTRRHALGAGLPARSSRRAKNGGVMVCGDWAEGECPYRDRLGCTPGDRFEGLQRGMCVVELRLRDEAGASLRELFEDHLESDERDEALEALERLLDALVYRDRAVAYAGVVMDRDADWMNSETYWTTLLRYREGGSRRLWRRYLELKPMIERAMEIRVIQGQPGVGVTRATSPPSWPS